MTTQKISATFYSLSYCSNYVHIRHMYYILLMTNQSAFHANNLFTCQLAGITTASKRAVWLCNCTCSEAVLPNRRSITLEMQRDAETLDYI
jgi:hypothetical protein